MKLNTSLLLSLLFLLNFVAPSFAGSATYYNHKLKGRLMTNGKPYNPNKLTAAHPSIKIGKTITVMNNKTGKTIRVVVTDRCNCSIDLSSAAYKALGGSKKKGRLSVSVL